MMAGALILPCAGCSLFRKALPPMLRVTPSISEKVSSLRKVKVIKEEVEIDGEPCTIAKLDEPED